MSKKTEERILNTLKYKSIFNSSVTVPQLYNYLLTPQIVDKEDFLASLESLRERKKVKVVNNKYYYLPKLKRPNNWKLRAKFSASLREDFEEQLKILQKIPWIKLLGITGSVSALNAQENDDLDVFIVTSRDRLWITRFFVFFFLKSLGKYPVNEEFSRKICPNILIDETALSWPAEKRSVYVANDICMLIPKINRDDMYFRFMRANSWVFDDFANIEVDYSGVSSDIPPQRNSFELIMQLIEFIFMTLQLWYMRKRKTTEITSKSFIHFNKYDHAPKVTEKYSSLVGKQSLQI